MQYEPGNFTRVPNTRFLSRLTTPCQAVWLAICIHADDDGKCYPSYKRFREVGNIKSNTTIKRCLDELVEAGFLTITSGAKKRKVNQYQMRYLTADNSNRKPTSTVNEQDCPSNGQADSTLGVEELYPITISNNYKKIFVLMKPINAVGYQEWFKRKAQKDAGDELFKLYEKNPNGFEFMLNVLKQKNGTEYFPSCYTPFELLNKFEKVRAYCVRNNLAPSSKSEEEKSAEQLGYSMDR